MTSLWFVVPAHGRYQLTRICLEQLRRTCDQLAGHDIDATAVVIADDRNLTTAHRLGFATVHRDNRFLSRRFNDGIQLAADKTLNVRPADYVVPCGSDDWIDHRILIDLPKPNTVVGFQQMAFVREDGREITTRFLNYRGGSGIRIYPRELLWPLGYRPADEDRYRGCDTSILTNLTRHHKDRLQVEHRFLHPYQVVDWKSRAEQLNSYVSLRRHRAFNATIADPFEVLADYYPVEALDDMRRHYQHKPRLVAV